MYLNQLSNEQRELFLDLCIHVSYIDESFKEEEKQYIRKYCEEMQITKIRYQPNNDLETIIKALFNISVQSELRIILFELLALIISDADYHVKEKEIVDKLLEEFKIETLFVEKTISLLKKWENLYKEINALIF